MSNRKEIFSLLFFVVSKKYSYLCIGLLFRYRRTHTYKRRFLYALVLTFCETRKFKLIVRNKATDALLVVYCRHSLLFIMFCSIYIIVGLSALLGSTIRAMREPTERGLSEEISSTFFICM